MDELKQLMTSLENTAYQRWLKGEGIPVVEGFGVEDVCEMRMGAWRRTGGNGGWRVCQGAGITQRGALPAI